jgi:hypothetical protein
MLVQSPVFMPIHAGAPARNTRVCRVEIPLDAFGSTTNVAPVGAERYKAKSLDTNVETADTECPRHGSYFEISNSIPSIHAPPLPNAITPILMVRASLSIRPLISHSFHSSEVTGRCCELSKKPTSPF